MEEPDLSPLQLKATMSTPPPRPDEPLSPGSPPGPLVDLAESLLISIQSIESLSTDESAQDPGDVFSLDDFWAKMSGSFQVLSSEATRLCVCAEPGTPGSEEAIKITADNIDTTVKRVASLLAVLPRKFGTALRRSTVDSTLGLVGAMFALVACMVGRSGTSRQQATATVWQWVEKLKKIPKDNRGAVLGRLKSTQELVVDALDELEDTRRQFLEENEDDRVGDDPEWTDSDIDLLTPCLGLIRACKGVLKLAICNIELNETADCSENGEIIASLDDFNSLADKISPAVDNFVCSLYPTVARADVMTLAESLKGVLHNFVIVLQSSHLLSSTNVARIDFLKIAINHNFDKIRNMTH